ncbi:dihydroorotate dehydrogenase B (NAD(+)), electron transfer subunit [Clostridium tepidiprofundi DSM 19306]|uniref:Dihydroorotate dehydrogenase B (NAD(+)), electron transfer subunit n=1 Tax=Clostridium tepidiprofundi DSM 19306 TaxID=1121338 RepID=A0A151AV12_9CLOT|nr:dihydroorotate dehydrogenase electron transfer subunit [Clostridium tepidiprofundi]KYH31478.1 dihydroorotate dehydrogenase B (NAD(+)), electron transfer subunit [Clostridium tepidiprofundi DSM 19306]
MICSVEKILDNVEIRKGIFKISIEGKYEAKPGQFYMLKVEGENILLPRPISVYDCTENYISFLYAVVGKGTNVMSKLSKGDNIQIMGPLGNGFEVDKIQGKIAIISGGIGIAPLHFLVKKINNSTIDFYAGFKTVDYTVDNVEKYVNNIYLSTENGSKGYKGYITDIFYPEKYDLVICCGPKIMMEKVVKMCVNKNIPVLVSMENRMACGIGACLVCTCKTKEGNLRVCKDGPVFRGEDLILND